MKLIEEANEFDKRSEGEREEEEEEKRKKKKKRRRKKRRCDVRSDIAELDSLGIKKQVTLSRPVTPATEQVSYY